MLFINMALGTVLIINGEATAYDQDQPVPSGVDPRVPQIFDPLTGTYVEDDMEPDGTEAFRGYHSWAVLLKDARILLGGGVWKYGGGE